MTEQAFKPYKIITTELTGYYEEKKSKFTAHISPCESEEKALSYIEAIRKKYYDARHNCTAMIIGANKELVRSSDDGEPSGTAGKPMLEVLTGADITNVVCVVTRYFGGVLLGTGGLVRAYQAAVKDALKEADIRTVDYCADIKLMASYNDINILQRFFADENITVLNSEYLEKVIFNIRVREIESHEILKSLTELTKGRADIGITGRGYEML